MRKFDIKMLSRLAVKNLTRIAATPEKLMHRKDIGTAVDENVKKFIDDLNAEQEEEVDFSDAKIIKENE
tara:strand:+ start:114 stop:320 length:207 start_codon:yes stop_codon:yes gene_type:complete